MQLSLRAGLVAVAALLAAALPPAIVWTKGSPPSPAPAIRSADFGPESPSPDARRVANWIAATRDNAGASFAIIDKKSARLHVFDGAARLQGSSPILIGAAKGDDTVPGIGLRPVADVRPEERTTPAGRFVVERGRNLRGEDVVWVSYADSVSMHPVLTEKPEEHRLARLAADFRRFDERMKKLADHIRQANQDAEDVQTSSRRISQQFQKIEAAEIEAPAPANVVRLTDERKP